MFKENIMTSVKHSPFFKKKGKRMWFITNIFFSLETKLFLIEELISALPYVHVDLELPLILVKNF